MNVAISFALVSPLIGFLALALFANRFKRKAAGRFASAAVFTSFAVFAGSLAHGLQARFSPESITLFKWIPIPGINADFSIYLDALSLLMALIITGIGFLIHVYSIGYMEHDDDFARYFACLNLFVFAMLLLVLGGNLLVLFVGWEGVGLASYLLIGYWYERKKAANAATKAFVMNRIGDFGLLVGLLLAFTLFGTGDIASIVKEAGQKFPGGSFEITVLTLLLFLGAVGKSAQFPLHTWLPDAMEGPTPVSALIHAATMVTAGVYLVVRLHPLFLLAPDTLLLIAIIGAGTSLFAAISAVGQTDFKRVLAYSTVSQLGLMFFACGVGAFFAAMFHLTMHAFIKALLFLSAGNVVHMMHGETEMDKMGGLKKQFAKTHLLFLIGVLAMSGIPPLAAFFSKEEILKAGFSEGFKFLYVIGLFTTLLTGFYLTRAWCLVFAGKDTHQPKGESELKEAPAVMLNPLYLLAALSLFGGFIGYWFGGVSLLEGLLSRAGIPAPHAEPFAELISSPLTWIAVSGSILGICAALFLFVRLSRRDLSIPLFKRAFFVDEVYEILIVARLRTLSRFIVGGLEPKVFDGSLALVAAGTEKTSKALRRIQSGQIRSYVALLVLGSALLIVYLVY